MDVSGGLTYVLSRVDGAHRSSDLGSYELSKQDRKLEMKEVQHLLFDRSPYEGFDREAWDGDLQGWASDHPILVDVIERIRPCRILEIGSWKGRSAVNMARKVRELGLVCEIVCVDTWLGSPEHWLKQGGDEDWYGSLKIRNGMPHLYNTFMRNVLDEGLEEIITPFPSTSENATHIFKERGLYFDFCYIDAAHEYEPVLRDLKGAWSCLREPGVLIGDDYGWSGVNSAANDFAAQNKLELLSKEGKFLIAKGSWWPVLTI